MTTQSLITTKASSWNPPHSPFAGERAVSWWINNNAPTLPLIKSANSCRLKWLVLGGKKSTPSINLQRAAADQSISSILEFCHFALMTRLCVRLSAPTFRLWLSGAHTIQCAARKWQMSGGWASKQNDASPLAWIFCICIAFVPLVYGTLFPVEYLSLGRGRGVCRMLLGRH